MINSDMIPSVYSTEEVKTNEKWIDGKPIYRKMVDIGILQSGVYRIQHNIKNASIIWIDLSNSFWMLIGNPFTNFGDKATFSFVYTNFAKSLEVDNSNILTNFIDTSFKPSNYHGIICLKYTKTTD